MKYVEIKDNVVVVEAQEQPSMPDLSVVGRRCIDVTNLKVLPKNGEVYNEKTNNFSPSVIRNEIPEV